MKKNIIIAALALATIALAFTSCKKDEQLTPATDSNRTTSQYDNENGETVTLSVTTEDYTGDSKFYIDNEGWSCWEVGDLVFVNNNKTNSSFSIAEYDGEYSVYGVAASEKYAAIFPYNIVPARTNANFTETGAWNNVFLPDNQNYTLLDNGLQKVDAPMFAYAASASAGLHFKNLCGLVKFNIASSGDIAISSIGIEAADGALSGKFRLDYNATDAVMTEVSGDVYAQLTMPDGLSVSVPTSFYMVLPPFSSQITIYIDGTEYYYDTNDNLQTRPFSYEVTSNGSLTLRRNHIATISIPTSVFPGADPKKSSNLSNNWLKFE